ncbi:MAG: DEAD/DEAH box helicase [Actinomycetota bacterium]|nr:DEAD/DEAH box helicase [Actinomycetota bacterium]
MSILDLFSPATRQWFTDSFDAPTPAQEGAWKAISEGRDSLVVAPTGSGKTLAAFLWSIDRLATASAPPPDPERLRVVYISPLRALAADIERNLKAPLTGIRNAASRSGQVVPEVTAWLRTSEAPADERRRFVKHPPDILITTPESLFLILTSQARDALRWVDTIIVDEVHAIAGNKRGAHLAVSLERLDALLAKPARRIGLSATVRPLDEVALFLGGDRDVTIVNPASNKTFDLSVVVPVEDLSRIGEELDDVALGKSAAGDPQRRTIWPALEERLVELITSHRSTIVFANSRRLSERLCARLNELAEREIARAHHGSVSREQRKVIEEDLKAGRLPAVVATSSLELGIDMGAVDLVVQVESPTSVASGLQRIGRAGHQVGAVSRGIIFPKWRGDLVECAVVVERMRDGAIEAIHFPRNPLDVLAQQVVAMVAMDDWTADELSALIRKASPFATLGPSVFEEVLDMLSGKYPSDEFAELRPRINYDRATGALTPRSEAQRLAVTSGGTIPDRGLFGVFLVGEKPTRVGELDEEMVYESRLGDVFTLGASSWRIEEITHDRVLVSPAPGQPAKTPFWHGDALGRPKELGQALGAFMREIESLKEPEALQRLTLAGLDQSAADNLIAYLAEQKAATGYIPTDRTIVVERFKDELGDWRIAVHSPFGAQLHAPWALAVEARVRDRLGVEVQTMHTDDGIVIRLPESDEAPPIDSILFDPEEIEALVTEQVGGSALFASRFRECAARALLLPRRRPGKRTPLWQQRQKSANLLQVASGYGSFPIVLETMRECLQDVFDVPGLVALMSDIRSRAVRLVEVDTQQASPFASSLLFGYVGAFIYEGDAPIAERRAQALSLDASLLAELLGRSELRELIDPDALHEIESELQRLTEGRRIRSPDDLHDALRSLGPLTTDEALARGGNPMWMGQLEESRRAIAIKIAGDAKWIAIEDSSRMADALGVPLPVGIPSAFLASVKDPVGDIVARFARTHGPFVPRDAALGTGLGVAVVAETLRRLGSSGRLVHGEFRPGGFGLEWCDAEVLRSIRRRSLAKLRKEVEPTAQNVLARFLPAWQGLGASSHRGTDGLVRVVEQLQGTFIPVSALETMVLPARVSDYTPMLLDQLTAAGEIVWAGRGEIGADDGWVSLFIADDAPLFLDPTDEAALSAPALAVVSALRQGGAMFFRQIAEASGSQEDKDLLRTIWELAWSGWITNDTLQPMRALTSKRSTASRNGAGRRRSRPAMPSRQGPVSASGRWSLLPRRVDDPTRRLTALAEQMLDRYGVLTRGAVMSEHPAGGFAGLYPVLKAFEESGKARRGYFVEGLGAAQFAVPGAVDRLRTFSAPGAGSETSLLAATDPANPFGAALPWPERPGGGGHRPGRKAGALVALVDGELVLYVERGGRTLLTWKDEARLLQPAVDALALAVRDGSLGKLAVEKADGEVVIDSPLADVLVSAGFKQTPKGLRLRA